MSDSAIALAFFTPSPYRQVAEIIDMPESTVKGSDPIRSPARAQM